MTFDTNRHLRFDDETETIEIDLTGLCFDTPIAMHRHFDTVEEAIRQSGRDRWYFIVNLDGAIITPEALPAYTHRAKALNLHHAKGTVRFSAGPETASILQKASSIGAFDFAHVQTREEALANLERLRSLPQSEPDATRSFRFHDLFPRVTFDTHRRIADIDMSGLVIANDRDARDLFDHIDARVRSMGPPLLWHALVNYTDTVIADDAWVTFARNGQALNEMFSLGTVRFGAPAELAREISERAVAKGFRANLCDTREEALAMVETMRSGRGTV